MNLSDSQKKVLRWFYDGARAWCSASEMRAGRRSAHLIDVPGHEKVNMLDALYKADWLNALVNGDGWFFEDSRAAAGFERRRLPWDT